VFDQTEYALNLSSRAYQFYTNYFETPEVVPKAGTRSMHSPALNIDNSSWLRVLQNSCTEYEFTKSRRSNELS